MTLSRSAILEANDLQIVEEQVPEWKNADGTPGVVRFRQLSAEGVLELTEAVAKDQAHALYIVLIRCTVDEAGNPLFTDADIPALKKKNLGVLNRLQRAALSVNLMSLQKEETLKNGSGEAAIVASLTDSPKS